MGQNKWKSLVQVTVCHTEISTSYGVLLYRISGGLARCGWLGPRAVA